MKKIILFIILLLTIGFLFTNIIKENNIKQQKHYELVQEIKILFNKTPVQDHPDLYIFGLIANKMITVYESRIEKKKLIDCFVDYTDWNKIERIDLQYCNKRKYGRI